MNESISTRKAILIGQVWVNGPVLILLISALIITYMLGYNLALGYICGAIPAWLYWSFMIPRWRKWALVNGANEEKLEKWGRITLLTFKKGSALSKTEFKPKEK